MGGGDSKARNNGTLNFSGNQPERRGSTRARRRRQDAPVEEPVSLMRRMASCCTCAAVFPGCFGGRPSGQESDHREADGAADPRMVVDRDAMVGSESDPSDETSPLLVQGQDANPSQPNAEVAGQDPTTKKEDEPTLVGGLISSLFSWLGSGEGTASENQLASTNDKDGNAEKSGDSSVSKIPPAARPSQPTTPSRGNNSEALLQANGNSPLNRRLSYVSEIGMPPPGSPPGVGVRQILSTSPASVNYLNSRAVTPLNEPPERPSVGSSPSRKQISPIVEVVTAAATLPATLAGLLGSPPRPSSFFKDAGNGSTTPKQNLTSSPHASTQPFLKRENSSSTSSTTSFSSPLSSANSSTSSSPRQSATSVEGVKSSPTFSPRQQTAVSRNHKRLSSSSTSSAPASPSPTLTKTVNLPAGNGNQTLQTPGTSMWPPSLAISPFNLNISLTQSPVASVPPGVQSAFPPAAANLQHQPDRGSPLRGSIDSPQRRPSKADGMGPKGLLDDSPTVAPRTSVESPTTQPRRGSAFNIWQPLGNLMLGTAAGSGPQPPQVSVEESGGRSKQDEKDASEKASSPDSTSTESQASKTESESGQEAEPSAATDLLSSVFGMFWGTKPGKAEEPSKGASGGSGVTPKVVIHPHYGDTRTEGKRATSATESRPRNGSSDASSREYRRSSQPIGTTTFPSSQPSVPFRTTTTSLSPFHPSLTAPATTNQPSVTSQRSGGEKQRVFSPNASPSVGGTNSTTSPLGGRMAGDADEFLGHYVVLVGYDPVTDGFLLRDPGTEEELCFVDAATLEAARSSPGTDHDAIVVRRRHITSLSPPRVPNSIMIFAHAVVALLATLPALVMGAPNAFPDFNAYTEKELFDRHLASLDRVYSNMLASNKVNHILASTRRVPDGTFSSKVIGRIHPFGRMNDLDDTVDYFWGMFGNNNNANAFQLFPEVKAYNISAFANTGEVAHAFIELTTSDFKGGEILLRQQAMFIFEEQGDKAVVSQFDIYLVNINAYFNILHGSLDKLDSVGKTCTNQRKICGNGLSDAWPLVNCEIALAFKGLGEAAQFGDDNILCRAAEVNLAYLPGRKGVHCNNLGPSGGSKCKSSSYKDYFVPIGKPFIGVPSVKENGNAQLQKDYNESKFTVYNVYNKTIFPFNLEYVAKGAPPPRTFSNNTAGRIWPVGVFGNTEDTVEYQFGIFGSQNSSNVAAGLIPVIQSFDIRGYVNNGHVAATSIDYVMVSPVTKQTYPLRVQGFWRLDNDYDVTAYDVQVQNTGKFYGDVGLNLPALITKPALAAAICISQASACTGVNQVYGGKGQPECFATLAGPIPFGDANQVMANSVNCRAIHVNLSFLRPDVHCKHVSITGGGKCYDHPYEDYFTLGFPEPFRGY
ncbi:hypothetical protein HDU97_004827 [Phlyctochytrium planicorne]|nr:hypothetical protein HDU97_004827 [Phlyctochytrium planicorne]